MNLIQRVCYFYVIAIGLLVMPSVCLAASLGEVAGSLLEPTRIITQLMYGVSYVAGAGMLVMAFLQYKVHRNNPSQVRLGTPIAYLMFAIALLLLPLIAQYSKSSEHAAVYSKAYHAKDNEPLEYGKHREARPAPARRQTPTRPAIPVDPADKDWY